MGHPLAGVAATRPVSPAVLYDDNAWECHLFPPKVLDPVAAAGNAKLGRFQRQAMHWLWRPRQRAAPPYVPQAMRGIHSRSGRNTLVEDIEPATGPNCHGGSGHVAVSPGMGRARR
jgi:hypothetical protein